MATSPLHKRRVVNILVRGKMVILCKVWRLGPYKYPLWHVKYDHGRNTTLHTTLFCLKYFWWLCELCCLTWTFHPTSSAHRLCMH
jgi:hypothetical protein